MKKYINIKYWILGLMFVLSGFVNVTFAQTANLTTNQPSDVNFEWHNALPISSNNLVVSPTAVIPGLYYGVNNFGTCYSEATPIRVATNSCPVATVDLNSFVETTVTPLGMTLTFHNASPVSDTNKLSGNEITAAAAGVTYYVAYRDNNVGCYSTESVIVIVNSSCLAAIVAVNDLYDIPCATTSTLGNVLTNDTIDTKSITSTDVIITLESEANTNISLNTTSGDLSMTNNLAYGIYTLGYKICQATKTTNCSSGTITISLVQPTEPEKVDCSDTYTFINCAWVKDNNTPTIR